VDNVDTLYNKTAARKPPSQLSQAPSYSCCGPLDTDQQVACLINSWEREETKRHHNGRSKCWNKSVKPVFHPKQCTSKKTDTTSMLAIWLFVSAECVRCVRYFSCVACWRHLHQKVRIRAICKVALDHGWKAGF